MIDSQMGKIKFGQRLKAGSKQAGVGVPFVITYHPKLKKIVQIIKKLEQLLYQDGSVERVFNPHQWFSTAVQVDYVAIWLVLSFTL